MLATASTHTDVRGIPRTYTSEMAKRRIVGIRQARENLRDHIDGAEVRGEHSILVRRSKVAAVVVPPEWYRDACRLMGDPWEDWDPGTAEDEDGS